jgi:1-acyl-sn-glycerol-3-phosphate acyltransferase
MSDFKPPIDNPFFVALCKALLPMEMWRAKIRVEVVGDGISRLRALGNQHVVVIGNHSDQYDPEVMLELSKLAGENFYFVAAREVFDWVAGLTGKCFQNLGCYSVSRGQADAESFQMTRKIIATGDRKLVIFPEGEVSRQPDLLMPLRPGAARLFLEGQEELLKVDAKHATPVLILPIGIRWCFGSDISNRLNKQLRKIERRLGIREQSSRTMLELENRTRAAASVMLAILEEEYLLPSGAGLPVESRIIKLRGELLRQLAPVVDVELQPDESDLQSLRRVHNAIRSFVRVESSWKDNWFRKRIHKHQANKMWKYVEDVHRVQRSIGVHEPDPKARMTQERLAALFGHLEREVLGYSSDKGLRIARVLIGEPFSVLKFYDAFPADKHTAAARLTETMSDQLRELMAQLQVHPDVVSIA